MDYAYHYRSYGSNVMTASHSDAEREAQIRHHYRDPGWTENTTIHDVMLPAGDTIFLLRLIAEARAEIAKAIQQERERCLAWLSKYDDGEILIASVVNAIDDGEVP